MIAVFHRAKRLVLNIKLLMRQVNEESSKCWDWSRKVGSTNRTLNDRGGWTGRNMHP